MSEPERAENELEAESAAAETGAETAAGAALTAAERRQNRERIGGAAMEKYLGAQAGDTPAVRRLKEDLRDQDLETSVGTLLDTGSPQASRDALDQMGITRDQSGKWRLRNPEPGIAETLPGSYADEDHLKAFMAGFVEASSLRDRVEVVREVYAYLGLPAPETAELLPEEKPGPPPAGARPEQTPLSKWKSVFDKLKRQARSVSLAISLVTIFGVIGPEKAPVAGPPAETAAIERVEPAPAPPPVETAAAAEQTVSRTMQPGDTVDGLVRSMLGENAKDEALAKDLVKEVLEINGISDPWYRTEGHFDSAKLPVGTRIDVTVVAKKLNDLRQIQAVRQDLEQMR